MVSTDGKLVLAPRHHLCTEFHRTIVQEASCHTRVSSIQQACAGMLQCKDKVGEAISLSYRTKVFFPVTELLTKPPGGHITWRFLAGDDVRGWCDR